MVPQLTAVHGPPRQSLILARPTLFLYDAVPGGVGFSEKLFALCDVLLQEALQVVQSCACRDGCPACVGPVGEVERGARAVAIDLARWLSGVIPRPQGPMLDASAEPPSVPAEAQQAPAP